MERWDFNSNGKYLLVAYPAEYWASYEDSHSVWPVVQCRNMSTARTFHQFLSAFRPAEQSWSLKSLVSFVDQIFHFLSLTLAERIIAEGNAEYWLLVLRTWC